MISKTDNDLQKRCAKKDLLTLTKLTNQCQLLACSEIVLTPGLVRNMNKVYLARRHLPNMPTDRVLKQLQILNRSMGDPSYLRIFLAWESA